LHRKLKRLTSQTPAAFVRQYRLNAAAKLLDAETSTVAEVAYEVGFGTPETFATRFEERFGCPPSAYPDEASSVPN
jgi:AraC-like DNA-binding protein